MNPAFKECLKHKKIIPFPRAKGLAEKELAAAEEDLIEAKDRFHNSRYKYSTINAYYAVFHAARALLYSRGYRETSFQHLWPENFLLLFQILLCRGPKEFSFDGQESQVSTRASTALLDSLMVFHYNFESRIDQRLAI
jgi:hypothetical protein